LGVLADRTHYVPGRYNSALRVVVDYFSEESGTHPSAGQSGLDQVTHAPRERPVHIQTGVLHAAPLLQQRRERLFQNAKTFCSRPNGHARSKHDDRDVEG